MDSGNYLIQLWLRGGFGSDNRKRMQRCERSMHWRMINLLSATGISQGNGFSGALTSAFSSLFCNCLLYENHLLPTSNTSLNAFTTQKPFTESYLIPPAIPALSFPPRAFCRRRRGRIDVPPTMAVEAVFMKALRHWAPRATVVWPIAMTTPPSRQR